MLLCYLLFYFSHAEMFERDSYEKVSESLEPPGA